MMQVRRPGSGFTLLEILVVLFIIAILMSFFLVTGGDLFGKASEKKTKTRLLELSNLVLQYRQQMGEFPNDRLPRGLNSNGVNAPCEALVVALFDERMTGTRPKQDWLVNTDQDFSQKATSSLGSKELFEFGDAWGNPILYMESLHYDETHTVQAGIDEVWEEQQAKAQRHERTGNWQEPDAYQLISAGEDGLFGTEDDLTHFQGS
ncbi:MAG: prepilin-type N-terminal cleavage/methylation domain-containing protein [Planctomycetota bacterium]|nr:MAG: prepilin-type N-terminal cleavage/methylation domain-containing protein [Planctomycetota bacterium]